MQTLPKLLLKALLCVVVASISACAPIKGYSGAELPDSQVSLIKNNAPGNVFIDGMQFYSWGIKVLPGLHLIEAERTIKSDAYNCHSREDFNAYGYSTCRDKREKDIREGDIARNCDRSTYTKNIEGCSYDFTLYLCKNEVRLVAGDQLFLEDNSFDESPMTLRSGTGQAIQRIRCKYSKEWTGYEETSY